MIAWSYFSAILLFRTGAFIEIAMSHEAFLSVFTQKYETISQFYINFSKNFRMFFLQKNDLNKEKIKAIFSQNFLTLISTLKEENKIFLTKMAPG